MYSKNVFSIIKNAAQIISCDLITIYQKWLSPFLGQHCRFYPSCSEYAKEAIMTHGILKSFYFIARRLLRCQPFHAGGFDPVISHQGHKNHGC